MTRFRHSALETFKACRRQYTLKYEMGLRPMMHGRRMPASGQRDTGSAAHAGVEVLLKGGSMEEATQAALTYVDITRAFGATVPVPPLHEDPEWAKVAKLAVRMVEGYEEWRGDTGIDAGRTILAVEQDWEVPLSNGHSVYGTIDLASYDPLHLGVLIEDHKTVDQLPNLHRANFQGRTYAWAWWRSTGTVPYGFRHRYLRRVLREGRAKPPFYDVSEILPTNEQLLLAHEAQLVVLTNEASAPTSCSVPLASPERYPHPSRDCSWKCDFEGVCGMVDSGDDVEHVLGQHYVNTQEKETPDEA